MITHRISEFWRACAWAVFEVRSDIRRTVLVLIGISLGCLALTSIASLTWHVREIVVGSERASDRRLLVVINRDAFARAPNDEFFDQLLLSVKRIHGVESAIPQVILPYRLDNDRTRLMAPELIIGADLRAFPKDGFASGPVGEISAYEVIIGSDVSAAESFAVGDSISLYGNLFHIMGVLRKQFTQQDQSLFVAVRSAKFLLPQVIAPSALKPLKANAAFSAIDVSVQDLADLPAVLSAINEIPNLLAHDPTIQVRMMRTALGILSAIAFGTVSITMVCAFAGVANVMLSAISARRSEIGLRRALGATRGQIFLEVLIEGMILGLGSSVVGIGLADVGGVLLSPIEHNLGATGLFAVDFGVAVFAIATTTLCGALAGLIPALEAAKAAPATALRTV